MPRRLNRIRHTLKFHVREDLLSSPKQLDDLLNLGKMRSHPYEVARPGFLHDCGKVWAFRKLYDRGLAKRESAQELYESSLE